MSERPLRASDHERDAAVLRRREQCAAGRLSIDELEQRIGHAYAATTRTELDDLLSDLPAQPSAQVAPRVHRIFWPGIAPFNEIRHLSGPCDEVYDAALREIVPRLGARGYQLVDERPARRMRLAGEQGTAVSVMFLPARGGGTDVIAFGQAPRAVRKAFATLSD